MIVQTYVFSSELPEQVLAPASGLYFFTVGIDNALLQPRMLDRSYSKSKMRVKVYLREPGSEQWKLLSGIVRIYLQGEEWNPPIAYPAGRAPMLKPALEWNIEMSPDEPTPAGDARSKNSEFDKHDVLVGSGSRGTR